MDLNNKNSGGACRLCDQNTEKMHNIFEKNEDGIQILHLIKECLPLIIYRTDPLSKKICEACFKKLGTFYYFKKTSIATNDKHIQNLRENGESSDTVNKGIQLFLGCEDSEMEEDDDEASRELADIKNAATSTDDLPISCPTCNSSYYENINHNNEVELCTDFHKALTNTLTINKVLATDPDKTQRARRRRSQAFYHELDDSLCSSLTEYTNTESSQYPDECPSQSDDVDSYDSDNPEDHKAKRRKLEQPVAPLRKNDFENPFKDEEEFIYNPLSLTALTLNVINRQNLAGYEPDDFYVEKIEPECSYCHKTFRNSKLLALHEVQHINIELGEKVDNRTLWHESRDDSDVRNKWLSGVTSEEAEIGENGESETPYDDENLLIPVGSEATEEERQIVSDIVVEDGVAYVQGVPLMDYSKHERKMFYKVLYVNGVNKRFCPLCRYTFKGNWGIEAHYMSQGCQFTCRYCGMRFNKQRASFDEHVAEHEAKGDPLSTKIFAASRQQNMVPKICQPDAIKQASEPQIPVSKMAPVKAKVAPPLKKVPKPLVKVKEEPVEEAPHSSRNAKSPNQAYFCRKCYKVFFKLDEFNVHSKNCDNNQFSPGRGKNGDMLSPSGRPMRNCVKELGAYKDEPDPPKDGQSQSVVCFICNTPFPTIYSRNSHMRVHKGENTTALIAANKVKEEKKREEERRSRSSFVETKVKKEALEPEVRIHEPRGNVAKETKPVAAVSITPISKNPNQKATINPNIMKLVQNNPHLTIKANQSPTSERSGGGISSVANNSLNSSVDGDKSYKCSSCWEAFNNKSHLYFHKKNQCSGSKYPCPFCKKRFGTETAYSSHIFYSHPE